MIVADGFDTPLPFVELRSPHSFERRSPPTREGLCICRWIEDAQDECVAVRSEGAKDDERIVDRKKRFEIDASADAQCGRNRTRFQGMKVLLRHSKERLFLKRSTEQTERILEHLSPVALGTGSGELGTNLPRT